MRSCNSSGSSCGPLELGLPIFSGLGEDGRVSMTFEHGDEPWLEDGGDWRINDSRHVRVPLVGVLIAVNRTAGFFRRAIGLLACEANEAAGIAVESIEPSLSLWHCASADRKPTLSDAFASTGSCIKTSFLFLILPSRTRFPGSKLE